ncbi:excinuclease ABC subunit UvrA [Paenibacillus flagellatus]|uniref:UvrABC system protein A n=1 Tax=Paenibacillus flagellatus TaxID=2211139 RepID=A0A2V5JTR8_9BACL|nr:excinuclease ABC subunit UvrA [Paenibacillus flagellatus]PYI49935.1 excinuclease ABC subunit A [Paenibacillus flagellatus]
MDDYIVIQGAREHNLKNVSLSIPKRKLVVLTGLSGSGKSSLAMETLQKECQRQYMESMGMVTDFISKPKVDSITGLSPSISVGQQTTHRSPRSTVGTVTEIYTYLRVLFAKLGERPCPRCGETVVPSFGDSAVYPIAETEESEDEVRPDAEEAVCRACAARLPRLRMAHFSFNKPEGACPSCTGLGVATTVDIAAILDEDRSVADGGVTHWDRLSAEYYPDVLKAAALHYGFAFDLHVPIRQLGEVQRDLLLHGVGSELFSRHFPGKKPPKSVGAGKFEGVVTQLWRRYRENGGDHAYPKKIAQAFVRRSCPDCAGTRLRPESRAVTIRGVSIADVSGWSLERLLDWLERLPRELDRESIRVWEPVFHDLAERIRRPIDVGLNYLTLNREANTLSGGEAQRLRLSSLLGSGLTGVLYVLDEPTAGLHPRDTRKLIGVLRKLVELGNTVLVIEHDVDVMRAADHLIDIGPGSGSAGGTVVASGTAERIMSVPDSVTGQTLREAEKPIGFRPRRPGNGNALTVRGATAHNLKSVTVSFPLGTLIALTGVSGSGKSTLLFDIVEKAAGIRFGRSREEAGPHAGIDGFEHIDKAIAVDQSPIGRLSRSNVATYTDLFTPIRNVFAALPEAASRKLTSRHFSFNVPGGRCEKCQGMGTLQLDMHFLPDVEVLCPVCRGRRFSDSVLAVTYKGFSISDILDMTVEECVPVFEGMDIADKLTLLSETGLGYLRLGQPSTTLSGGEAGRVKLARELGKPGKGHTLYLLDEPTTGLHPRDVSRLRLLLDRLVDAGNTVIVIEHNPELIAYADWIADFGPEGGEAGGSIVAQGTPEQVAMEERSHTGRYLKSMLGLQPSGSS